MNGGALQQSHDYQTIEQAIQFLESNFHRQPSLEEIAGSVYLSKFHFQRLFKRWAGVSPSQFMQFLTLEYAKKRLREAETVLEATLEAGLSSTGRLHDLFINFEAVTPGEYKRFGAGLTIAYGFHDTPFGRCLLATTERGICGLQFVSGPEATTLAQLSQYWPKANFVERGEAMTELVQQIFALAPAAPSRPFHLLLKGTNFQIKVWQALLTIPPGAMVTYQNMAAYLGNPQATRAVASAIARNPIGYLIPCHRVISKNGHLHRYQWGPTRKKAILGWEASRCMAPGFSPA